MKNIIKLTEGRHTHILPVQNILRMDSAGAYTLIHMKDGKAYIHCRNLGTVEKYLRQFTTLAEIFFRVHRSHVANLNEVQEFKYARRGGKLIMSDNAAVRVATRRKTELIKLLKKLK